MPLSAPAPRKLEHLRDIQLRGYVREDGLVDIEAHLTDTKTYGFPSEHRGQVGGIGVEESLGDAVERAQFGGVQIVHSCTGISLR